MGCDIHISVEKKVKGIWTGVSDKFAPKNPYWTESAKPGSWNYKKNYWRLGRNYDLFSILAGVRGEWEPMISPRGLPEDCSKLTLKKYSLDKLDAHTESFYTLKELLSFQDHEFTYDAYLDVDGWIKYKEINKIKEFEGSFRETVEISNEEMIRVAKMAYLLDSTDYVTKVSLKKKFGDISKIDFWNVFVSAMAKVPGNPEDVRLVFWFDN